jgi:hypothetical protein
MVGCRVETGGYTIELVLTEKSVQRPDTTLDLGVLGWTGGLGFVIH